MFQFMKNGKIPYLFKSNMKPSEYFTNIDKDTTQTKALTNFKIYIKLTFKIKRHRASNQPRTDTDNKLRRSEERGTIAIQNQFRFQ